MSNRQAVQEALARKRSKRTCIHRWVLGEPIEGEIHGQCRLCDATRTYPANPEGNDRFDDYRELTAASSYHWARNERKSA